MNDHKPIGGIEPAPPLSDRVERMVNDINQVAKAVVKLRDENVNLKMQAQQWKRAAESRHENLASWGRILGFKGSDDEIINRMQYVNSDTPIETGRIKKAEAERDQLKAIIRDATRMIKESIRRGSMAEAERALEELNKLEGKK